MLGGVNDLRVSDGVEAVIDLRIPDGEVLNVYLFGDAATWHDGVTHLCFLRQGFEIFDLEEISGVLKA